MTTNGFQAWMLAARPKTLSGAVAPVLVGVAAAVVDVRLMLRPAALCLIFAVLMQITANFVNDYVDFTRARDKEDRLGPKRACAEGWITPATMRRGIAVMTVMSCLSGLPLILWGGWWLIALGALCVVFCFLYSTTLSERCMGDVLVLVFFGLVPVCATYYLQTGRITPDVLLYSIAMGMTTDTLLIVNNYRDIEQDRANGKLTLAVAMGSGATLWLYLATGLVSAALAITVLMGNNRLWQTLLLVPYALAHVLNYWRMRKIGAGKELNSVLATTGFSIFLFAILLSMAIVF